MGSRQPAPLPQIASDVLEGLTREPKSLPPKLFYDAQGSRLFEEITELPEYYLTRTERAILERHAREMMQAAGDGLALIELGAGSSAKTRILLRAVLDRQMQATYTPIDVSAAALEQAAQELRRDFPRLKVKPIVGDYTHGLPGLRSLAGRKLVLYIGSSIGNFEPADAVEMLSGLSRSLSPGDALLLGTDLRKDPALLLPAYDDARGVTECFNKNILARINRELGGRFNLNCFRHVAHWNARASRIEIYLESRAQQQVRIQALGITVSFREGERIHTENSYKYTLPRVRKMLRSGGFSPERTWADPQKWFAVHLARKA